MNPSAPVSWSDVAEGVSGDRLSQAANRLQLWMWLCCVCGLSLRAAMSSIIRWTQRTDTVSLAHGELLPEWGSQHLDSQDGAPHRAIAIFSGPAAHAPRAAGWSAATSCIGPTRRRRQAKLARSVGESPTQV